MNFLASLSSGNCYSGIVGQLRGWVKQELIALGKLVLPLVSCPEPNKHECEHALVLLHADSDIDVPANDNDGVHVVRRSYNRKTFRTGQRRSALLHMLLIIVHVFYTGSTFSSFYHSSFHFSM